ncbi:hypothetical protein CARUB_v10025641mg [Capsella rubella]|uniref:Plant thionin family protein n=1 Tax=Capsella rubella TaxID=81985 RepID=R0HVB1_9BRAS|nr:uncharacterized protein LOC17889972 [Capsella rubella]EOA29355.1 hypothetical protein CARUB_v10025641mg [Capsella rubella]
MGKVISIALLMMVLAVIVIECEAKSEIECTRICRKHCTRTSPVSECAACRKKCYESPPAVARTRRNSMFMESEEEKHR